jgi:hypothetical protein
MNTVERNQINVFYPDWLQKCERLPLEGALMMNMAYGAWVGHPTVDKGMKCDVFDEVEVFQLETGIYFQMLTQGKGVDTKERTTRQAWRTDEKERKERIVTEIDY